MDIKIDLSPEQIQEHVTKALVESAIGKRIVSAIEETMKPGWNQKDPLKDAISAQASLIIMELVREEYSEKIKEVVRARITDELIEQTTSKVMSKIFDEILEHTN